MKSKLAIVSLWILVFLLGGAAGAIGQYLYHKHLQESEAAIPPKPMDPAEGLARALKMDAAQKESLKAILGRFREQWHQLNKQFGPQYEAINKQYRPQFEEVNKQYKPLFDAIRNESDEKIKKMLRPDQRAQFEQMLQKFVKPPQGAPKPPSAN
jgi:hypothetical protein